MARLVATLLFVGQAAFVYARDNCFPGTTATLSSPTKRYSLTWEAPKNDDDTHHLFITQPTKRELLAFEREVCIHWAPSERFFAVSDYVGSNVAEVYLYDAEHGFSARNLTDYLPTVQKTKLGKSSHGYVEATGWEKNELRIHVWGDLLALDAREDFEFRMVCKVTSASIQCH